MTKHDLDSMWIESQLRDADWRKSSLSSGGTNCVEVAFLDRGLVAHVANVRRQPGLVALRDSKAPDKPAHIFTDAEYEAFVGGIERGELRRWPIGGPAGS